MVTIGNTWLALVCLLALSNSGRHERTAERSLLLCAGPIAGCFAVLAVRRYCCGFRWLVCASMVCAEEAGSKTELRGCLRSSEADRNNTSWLFCVPRRLWLAELIQLRQCLSKKSTSPAAMFASRLVLPSAIWLGLRRAPACVTNMPRSLAQTHTRALLRCCCIAVVVLLLLLLSLALVTCHPRALSVLVARHTAPQIAAKKRKHGRKKRKKGKKRKTSFGGYKKENVQLVDWKNEKTRNEKTGKKEKEKRT